jgi:hypothetical protein
MSGHIFYNYDLEKPSILVSIIAMFLKQSWGFLVAFVLLGLIYQYGWFVPGIFNHPGWRITGRISFAGYIFHNIVVQLLIMDIYQPIHMDTVKFVSYLTKTVQVHKKLFFDRLSWLWVQRSCVF